jgi:hypothetical protein
VYGRSPIFQGRTGVKVTVIADQTCPDLLKWFGPATRNRVGSLILLPRCQLLNTTIVQWEFMDEEMTRPAWLRITAALLLGVMIGGILFLIAALIIGAINDSMGISIPINLRVAENLWSAVLLVIFIGFSIVFLWWKVETTPPSEPETPYNTVPDIPDELVGKI